MSAATLIVERLEHDRCRLGGIAGHHLGDPPLQLIDFCRPRDAVPFVAFVFAAVAVAADDDVVHEAGLFDRLDDHVSDTGALEGPFEGWRRHDGLDEHSAVAADPDFCSGAGGLVEFDLADVVAVWGSERVPEGHLVRFRRAEPVQSWSFGLKSRSEAQRESPRARSPSP